MLLSKVLCIVSFGIGALAAPAPAPVYTTTEANLPAAWNGPMYQNFINSINGTVNGVPRPDGGALPIPWRFFGSTTAPGTKNTVVVVNGHGESLIKYRELVYDFNQNGLNVLTFDHRGQGFAGRVECTPSYLGDVDHWGFYSQDMQSVIQAAQADVIAGHNLLLWAHSMGGGIAAGYLEQYPTTFAAAVLSSPMLEINTAPYPGIAAFPIAEIVELFGKCNLAPGQTAAPAAPDFSTNTAESSQTRYDITRAEFEKFPQAKIGGTTARWIAEAMAGIAGHVVKASSVKTPTQLHQMGKDTYVKPEGQNVFCNGIKVLGITIAKPAASCKLLTWPTSEHEIWLEVDSIRQPYMNSVVSFFRNYMV
ncbi:hypothetical protein HDU87_005234 [Geranomyces variabilis]|uniref:Serine aminopeptidase S33 domain-containing protein n=1 Tax=Geranomyces variabilis TaxID=109894 RepID=A0AAD5THS9_9FUNG|nr:hypothetical protein HDU87_005234 [Geranomyces variabilis]